MLMSIKKKKRLQRVYLWFSFLTSTAKKELMLLLDINFIVKEIIMILLRMWRTAAPFLTGSGLWAVPGMGWLSAL